jgi:hypothetical protein
MNFAAALLISLRLCRWTLGAHRAQANPTNATPEMSLVFLALDLLAASAFKITVVAGPCKGKVLIGFYKRT